MANTYKRLDDKRIEINGVIYTDGGSAPSAGSAPVYPSEYIGVAGASTPAPSPTASQAQSAAPATNPTNAANPSGYTYTPGSTAPVGGTAMDYATWLQGNTKHQAGITREKAVNAAEADRQRAVVDAASAFDKSKVTYGANAERAASMGLQNSGYGEYLTGKAYATQRGEVQNANKAAEARKDEALYTEGQMNIAADQKYAADLLGIKEDRNNSYNSLYNSATNGASIESIMQDSRWGTLTKEQQTAISQATTANSLMTRLQAGESLDVIKSGRGEEWNSLTVDQQAKLRSFYEGKVKAEADAQNSTNATNYGNWLSAILGGTATLEQIKTMPGYNQLPDDMKAQLQAAQSKIESGKNDTIAYNSIATDIKNGNLTSEALEADERFKAITDESLKSKLRNEAETADTERASEAEKNTFNNLLRDIKSGRLSAEDLENRDDFKGLKDESWKEELRDAAADYQSERASEAHVESYDEFLRNAENGDYTAESITKADGWDKFSDTEKDQLLDAARDSERAKNNTYLNKKNGIIKDMTLENFENYTDAYLDDLIAVGSLDEAGKAAIQETRANIAFNSAVDSVKNYPSSVTTTEGFDDFHNQIKYLKNNNFISYPEYLQLFYYAKEIWVSARDYYDIPGTSAIKSGDDIYVYYNNSKFVTQRDKTTASTSRANQLYSKVPNPSAGAVYRIDGYYYTYSGGSWYGITDATVREKFDSILKKPTAPTRGQ